MNNPIFAAVIAAAGLMSFINFILFGVDKGRAKRNMWRIRERTFFIVGLLFGALGGILGMQVFRHKTKHAAFKLGMPLLFVLNLICAYLIVWAA